MPTRREIFGISHPGFVADQGSQIRSNGGRQIAWDEIEGEAYDTDIPGRKRIPAGTVMSELEDGRVVPRAAVTVDQYDEPEFAARFIIETEADEGNLNHAISGYGMLLGGVLYENLLPEAEEETDELPEAYKEELNGVNRTSFLFVQYEDSRTDVGGEE